MATESNGESTEAQEENTDNSAFPRLSRRMTIASLLGIGGLGVVGTSRPTEASAPPQSRPWNQDVDAQGNDLLNLGALVMAANSKAITDFEGQNLTIDDEGALTATGVSPWEDTNADGRLETPDHSGIDVGETNTDQVTVGGGNPVTGIWGDQGEKVPLLSRRGASAQSDTTSYPTTSTSTTPIFNGDELIIPYNELSFTNISGLYVSFTALLAGPISSDGTTGFARLFDETNNVPIPESETQGTLPGEGRNIIISGPKAAYNPQETVALGIQAKSSEEGKDISVQNVTVQIWGEIT